MKKTNKKAFTIVELVIVIAVIAILAAVLIPTFSSLVERANRSADIQAVTQMNIALMAGSIPDKPGDIQDVIDILDEAGFNSKERLMPISKGHTFYWHSFHNVIILAKDEPAEVIHPKDNQDLVDDFAADLSKTGEDKVLYDLAGEYNDKEVTVPVTGVTLNRTSVTLAPNGTVELTATVEPGDATNKTVTWKSDNTAVATVVDGVVTPVDAGTTTIRVTTADGGYTATCTVTVTETKNIVGIYLPHSVELYCYTTGESGETTLVPQYIYEDSEGNRTYEDITDIGRSQISWRVEGDGAAISMVESGLVGYEVIAEQNGEAIIIATLDGMSASCVVTVKTIRGIVLSQSLAVLYRDGTGANTTILSAMYVCTDGTTIEIPADDISWETSSDISSWLPDISAAAAQKNKDEIATLAEEGSIAKITAQGHGLVTVEVNARGFREKCRVIVGNGLYIDGSGEKLSHFEVEKGEYVEVLHDGTGTSGELYIIDNACSLESLDMGWESGYYVWASSVGTATIACISSNLSYIGCSTITVGPDFSLAAKLSQGGNITLEDNVTIEGSNVAQIGITNETVLDLNGKTLTLDGDFYDINVFDKLTIKNGTVILNRTSQLHAAKGGTLTLTGVNVTQKHGGASGVTNYGTVVIDNCQFVNDNPGNNSVISNGTVREGVPIPGTMTIKGTTTIGGTFNEAGMPVIWNNSGTLTFEGNVVITAVIPESWIYHFGVIDVDERYAECDGSVTINGEKVSY